MPIVTIDNFPVAPGDTIRMSVWAFTPSSGQIQIENLTKNKNYQLQFSGETDLLCFESAEWIVEDFSIGSDLAPFANFTTITFTDTYSNKGGLQSADTWDISNNAGTLTKCLIHGIDSVTCKFV